MKYCSILCKHHVCYYKCSDVNKYLFYSFFALFLLKLESFGSFSSSLFSDAFLFIFFMLLLAFWPLESHSAIRFLDFSSALLSFAVSKSIGSTLFGKLWLLFLTFPTSRDTGCHAIWKRIFKKTYKNKFFFSVNQSFGVLLMAQFLASYFIWDVRSHIELNYHKKGVNKLQICTKVPYTTKKSIFQLLLIKCPHYKNFDHFRILFFKVDNLFTVTHCLLRNFFFDHHDHNYSG